MCLDGSDEHCIDAHAHFHAACEQRSCVLMGVTSIVLMPMHTFMLLVSEAHVS